MSPSPATRVYLSHLRRQGRRGASSGTSATTKQKVRSSALTSQRESGRICESVCAHTLATTCVRVAMCECGAFARTCVRRVFVSAFGEALCCTS